MRSLLNFIVVTVGVQGSPLPHGVEFRRNLAMGEVICHSIPLISAADRVIIKASVVGLTGNPNLFGGWDEKEVLARVNRELAPVNSGGYMILSESLDLPPNRNEYFVCVTSFATQGSDYLLTASVADAASWLVPPIFLIESLPVVWRIDSYGRDYVDFVMNIEDVQSDKNLTVSVTPFSGEIDIQIWNCDAFLETLGASALAGPDVLTLALPPEISRVCIRAHSSSKEGSEFALVASVNKEGPFLAQSVPIAGIGRYRVYYNQNSDLSITAHQGGEFAADTVNPITAWTSDIHGKLDLSRSTLPQPEQDGIVYISFQNPGTSLLTLTSHGTVEELELGLPLSVRVDSNSENRFKDFRVWIPSGLSRLTIQADSSEDGSGLGIFASSVRTSHDPRGYKWNTMEGTNEIILNTESGGSMCNGCYLYVSVKSCVVVDGACKDSGQSQFWLTVSADTDHLHLVNGHTLRSAFIERKEVVLPNPEEDKLEDLVVYITPVSGDGGVKVHVGATDNVPSDSGFDCGTIGETCRLVISKDDAARSLQKPVSLVLVCGGKECVVDVGLRIESALLQLRNHHGITLSSSAGNSIDRFGFYIPESVNGMINFAPSKSDGTLTVCRPLNGDCQSVTGTGIIHIKDSGLVSLKVESSEGYSLIPSFYSSVSNALRLNYKPVSFKLDPQTKTSWEVGYSVKSEWLISSTASGDAINMCIPDNDCCCVVPCSLQGFGRQQVIFENTNTNSVAVVSVSTKSLSVLEENVALSLPGRDTNVFRVPFWPAKLDTSGTVEFMIGSLTSDALLSPPAVEDVGVGQVVFVRITGGDSVMLIPRHELFLNEWVDNPKWSRVMSTSEILSQSRVRIEACSKQSLGFLSINRQTVSGPFLDIDEIVSGSEFHVSSSSPDAEFRLGLHSSKPTELSIVPEISSVVFRAPKNSLGSLYRVLCLSGADVMSQCALEKSPFSTQSSPVSCDSEADCFVPIPSNCLEDSAVTVVADRGSEFGLFSPIPLTGGLAVEPDASSASTLAWLVWFLVKLVAIWATIRWCITNTIRLRIWLFRAIDFVRGGQKSRHRLLDEDMMYREMKEPTITRYGRQGEMVNYRGNSGGGYSGA